jgi:hypothetical protein
MTLNKDQILEASDLTFEEVQVPEWNGAVKVRTMTGTDRDLWEQSMVEVAADGSRKPDMTNMRAKLVALTVVDDDGNLVFSMADVPMIARKAASALERVFDVAQRINGLGTKAEDDAVKNSNAGPSESSISA